MMDVITDPRWDLSLSMLFKQSPDDLPLFGSAHSRWKLSPGHSNEASG